MTEVGRMVESGGDITRHHTRADASTTTTDDNNPYHCSSIHSSYNSVAKTSRTLPE